MNLQSLLYRFRWLHTPVGILMLLLQRTPVLRMVVSESPGFGLQSGEVLKSAFALAALGAYNSVAGATVFNATATAPTTVTPASGGANTTFNSSVAANSAYSLAFSASGAPGTVRSWKVAGTLPTGITVTGGTAITGGYTVNGLKVTIAGTPTAAGNNTVTVTAYDGLSATGNNARVTCVISVTGGVTNIAPSFTTQPVSQTVAPGGNITFTAAATGTPTPTLQWYQGTTALSGQTGGSLTLTNVQAANAGNYTVVATNSAAPTGVSSNIAALTLSQTITFGALAGKTYGNAPFTVSATASSGLAPTYSIVSGPATLSGNTVTLTGVGTVTVRASQAGNATYTAATPVDQSFSVGKATATVSLGNLAQAYTGSALSATATTVPAGLTVALTYNASATAPTNAGSYTVAATINDTLYQGSATGTLVISQASQTITFGALANKSYGDAPFTVGATSSSGLTPTFSIVSGPATISGNTVTLTGVGTVTVRASQAGNANFAAAPPVDQIFSVGLTAQTITFGALATKTYGDAPFTVSANATSGLTPTFSIVSGPATLSGNTVTITGAGTVTVRASQSGNATYAAATSVDQSFSVAQAAQTITFGALASKAAGDAPFTVSATASSGLAPTFSIVSGPATISGNTITITGVGTVTVRASQAGNTNYAAATPVDQSFSVGLTAQTITFGTLANKTYGDAPFTVSATASSGLTPTFSIVSGPATLSGNTVTITGAGTVTVRASQSGNSSYAAATPVDQNFSVGKATASVSLGNLAQSYTGSALSATATTVPAGLNVALTYNASSTAPTSAGSYAVVATINDALYQGSASGSLVISQASQSITFGALAAKTYGDAPFTLSATASSGLTPTFSIVSGPATISGSTVTITGVGTVTIRASQAGNANYAAATPVDQSFSVAQAAQTITFGALANKAAGDAPFTVSATATSGLAPTFSIVSGPATISGNTVTLTGVGTVTVRASQAGNTNYAAATPVDQSFSVGLTAQTITFGALANKTYGDAAFTISATATSGLSPTFSIVSGPATISGNTITLTGVGTVTVRASQAGNATHAAATPVDQSFSVGKATASVSLGNLTQSFTGSALSATATTVPSGLTIALTYNASSTAPTNAGSYAVVATINDALYQGSITGTLVIGQASQSITFGALSAKTYGDAPFTVSATATSGLAQTFSIVSGPATISGNTITLTGVGTVTVRASQAGNANYAAATPVDQSFSVGLTAQTITFGALVNKTYGDAPFTVSATSTSGLTPTFSIVSGHATISGNTVTLTGAGTVTVRASQTGNATFAAATPVDQSFSVAQAAQTITFGALASKAAGDAPFTVSATASSGLAPTFSIVSGPATISGNTVTLTGVGTVTVRASQAGNTNYAAATPVDQSFSVGLTAQTVTFGTLANKTYGDAAFTISASASSGLAPTFSIVSGPATISGNTVTLTGVGTVTVRASQSGNATYAAATPVDQNFSVGKATASVSLGNLAQSYTGSALSATATTVPAGLNVALTYNASSTAPTSAGSYAVVATINDSLYQGSATGTLVISQAAQSITFGALSAKTYGDAAFTVSATATSGLSPTFSIVSGPATISGSTVTLTGVGTVLVRASQSGNTNYAAATPVDQSFSVGLASQTITFGALSAKTYGDAPFTVSATASSGLTPTFSIVSGPATISSNTVTLTGAGTVIVRASQSGNANYSAATSVDQSFSVAQAAQTITFGALANKATGDAPFAVSATASSGLAPTFSIVSGPATISGNTVTLTGVGTVTVRASQAGNANYAAATPVDQSFSVGITAQTITFGALANKTYGDAPFTVSATASSGLTPTFSIVSGPATISGNTVTLTGVGTVTVRASQSGNTTYAAATPVDQSFSVGKATASVSLGNLTQSYTGSALSATATTVPAGLTVSLTYNASSTAPTSAGSYAVVATINDALYQGSITGTLVIGQASQSITFGALSAKTYGDVPFTLSATATSGLTPTFSIVSGPATISGSTVTLTGGGTVVVRATQAGNANYSAAASVDQSFSVTAAPVFTSQPASQTALIGGNVTFTVSVTGVPAPTLKWYQGTTELSGQTGTSLSLSNVQLASAGSYSVKAFNSVAPAGVSSNAATLTVSDVPPSPAAPVITRQPAASTVAYIGDKVTLTVTATGYPEPSYQWKRGGGILTGQTGPSLVINAARIEDSDTYTVTVSNSVNPKGLVSSPAKLTVLLTPPALVTAPAGLLLGDRLTLDLSGGATYPAGVFFRSSRLPEGITLDPATGRLDGILSGRPANYTVTYWTQLGKTRSTQRTLRFSVGAFPSGFAGGFDALLDTVNVDPAAPVFPAGKVELSVASDGTYTGRLYTGDVANYPLRGKLVLGADRTSAGATVNISRQPSGQSADYQLVVNVNQSGAFNATLAAGSTAVGTGSGFKLTGRATPANYTLVLRNAVNLGAAAPALPAGDGSFTVSCSSSGLLTLRGRLGDGTYVSTTASLGADGFIRLYANPYLSSGAYLAGTLAYATRSDLPNLIHITAEGGSDLYWNKPARSGDRFFPAGFGPLGLEARMEPWLGSSRSAIATRLNLPAGGNFVVDILGPTVSGAEADFVASLPVTLYLSPRNVLSVVGANPTGWKLQLDAATGRFTGTCEADDDSIDQTFTIEGVFLQSPAGSRLIGGGYIIPSKDSGDNHSNLLNAVEFNLP